MIGAVLAHSAGVVGIIVGGVGVVFLGGLLVFCWRLSKQADEEAETADDGFPYV
ncbi:MAG: hypothetical protein OXE93_01560 [bacterium]|nr:hypothetical protein [bacterium]